MLNLNYFVVRNKTVNMSFISLKRQILLAKSKVGYKFDKTEYFKVEIVTKNQLSLTVIFYSINQSINALFIIMHFTVFE